MNQCRIFDIYKVVKTLLELVKCKEIIQYFITLQRFSLQISFHNINVKLVKGKHFSDKVCFARSGVAYVESIHKLSRGCARRRWRDAKSTRKGPFPHPRNITLIIAIVNTVRQSSYILYIKKIHAPYIRKNIYFIKWLRYDQCSWKQCVCEKMKSTNEVNNRQRQSTSDARVNGVSSTQKADEF